MVAGFAILGLNREGPQTEVPRIKLKVYLSEVAMNFASAVCFAGPKQTENTNRGTIA